MILPCPLHALFGKSRKVMKYLKVGPDPFFNVRALDFDRHCLAVSGHCLMHLPCRCRADRGFFYRKEDIFSFDIQ